MDNGASSYRRFLDGDESAFDSIMKEYFDSLIFFVNRYVHDIHTAEDIAIDAFCDLIVHPHRYNFSVSLKTYLFMIAKSRALNYIKRNKRIVLAGLDLDDADADWLERTVLCNEQKRIVNDALRTLPTDMQIAVHLVYFEDMSYAQTAKVMKKSTKQIDNLLYRAKAALRTVLRREGELLL